MTSRLSRLFLLAGLPLLLALVVPAAAGKPLPSRIEPTAGRITGLAFDGSRVVYGVQPNGSGVRTVHVWNVATGTGGVIHRHGGGAGFAVAGSRAAWIARGGSASETDEYLLTTSLPRVRLRQLAVAVRFTDSYSQVEHGRWLSGLVGSGNVIAVSSWTTASDGAVSSARLSLVGETRLRPIVVGQNAIVAESADAGRIAVVRSTAIWPGQFRLTGGPGSVGVYSTGGKLVSEVNRGTAKEAALSGNSLAVLTTANTIELYNATTGAFVRSWPVPAGAAHLDLQSGIAVYAVYPRSSLARKLHVLRLSTGKDVVIATGEAPYPYAQGDDAQIDELGLVYAQNIRTHGKLVFLPMARVLAKLHG